MSNSKNPGWSTCSSIAVRTGIDDRRIRLGFVPDRASGVRDALCGFKYRSIVAADIDLSSPSTASVTRSVALPNSPNRTSRSKVSAITAAKYFPDGWPDTSHTTCSTLSASYEHFRGRGRRFTADAGPFRAAAMRIALLA